MTADIVILLDYRGIYLFTAVSPPATQLDVEKKTQVKTKLSESIQ